jgi:hypothetical protein
LGWNGSVGAGERMTGVYLYLIRYTVDANGKKIPLSFRGTVMLLQ